jgi:hypothetical protein
LVSRVDDALVGRLPCIPAIGSKARPSRGGRLAKEADLTFAAQLGAISRT